MYPAVHTYLSWDLGDSGSWSVYLWDLGTLGYGTLGTLDPEIYTCHGTLGTLDPEMYTGRGTLEIQDPEMYTWHGTLGTQDPEMYIWGGTLKTQDPERYTSRGTLRILDLDYLPWHMSGLDYNPSKKKWYCMRFNCVFVVVFVPNWSLKVVCRLALAIWSYWYGCRERIFLNISKAANPRETP